METNGKPKRERAKKAPSEAATKRASDKAEKKKQKDFEAAQRKKVANARKERRFKTQEKRDGEKHVRSTYREGTKDCRTKRRASDTPHREALAKSKIDFQACRSVVEGDASRIFFDEVAPLGPVIARLERLIPPPARNPRTAHNQELWIERLDQARADLMQRHPELAPHVDRLLGPVGQYGSKAARELRSTTDRLVQGRQVMSIAELLEQRAIDAGWSEAAGLEGAASLNRAAESEAARSVQRRMDAGPPASVQEILGRLGPSSATVPSQVRPSALEFPPRSVPLWSPPSGTAAGWAPASGLGRDFSQRPGMVEELITAAQSSRRAAPSARPPRRARAAKEARGQGPGTRSPKTQVSPGSEAPPKAKKPRKTRAKKKPEHKPEEKGG